MSIEDIVMSFNRFLEDNRKYIEPRPIGYCAILKKGKSHESFGAYKELLYEVYFIVPDKPKQLLLMTQYQDRIVTNKQLENIHNYMSEEITKMLFHTITQTDVLTSLINGTYDRSKFVSNPDN